MADRYLLEAWVRNRPDLDRLTKRQGNDRRRKHLTDAQQKGRDAQRVPPKPKQRRWCSECGSALERPRLSLCGRYECRTKARAASLARWTAKRRAANVNRGRAT